MEAAKSSVIIHDIDEGVTDEDILSLNDKNSIKREVITAFTNVKTIEIMTGDVKSAYRFPSL